MSCAVIIFDCNAASWGQLTEKWEDEKLMKKSVASIVVYANAHLSLSASNKLVVIAAGVDLPQKTIFTSEGLPQTASVAERIDAGLRSALEFSARSENDFAHTNYAPAFALAACQFSRFKRDTSAGTGRIVVLNLSAESHGEQAKLMNLFLGAQQQELKIHVCSLGRTNPMLRQASDVSGGVHRQISSGDDLSGFLTRLCLANTKEAEDAFAVHNFERIDYQASCYCHDQPVSVGFVCSVCLAVHCQYLPICSACGTVFKLTAKPL